MAIVGTPPTRELELDPRTTALVLIDLQQGILGYARAPHEPGVVLANAALLAQAFRAKGAVVVRVKVGWSADFGDQLKPPVDEPMGGGSVPENWLDDPEQLPSVATDLPILKRQWGAFTGTDLDLQLRRRGIRTLVLGGIATPFGVESTCRFAHELGYEVILPEDLSSAPHAELHRYPMTSVFPRIARVRTTAAVLAGLR